MEDQPQPLKRPERLHLALVQRLNAGQPMVLTLANAAMRLGTDLEMAATAADQLAQDWRNIVVHEDAVAFERRRGQSPTEVDMNRTIFVRAGDVLAERDDLYRAWLHDNATP